MGVGGWVVCFVCFVVCFVCFFRGISCWGRFSWDDRDLLGIISLYVCMSVCMYVCMHVSRSLARSLARALALSYSRSFFSLALARSLALCICEPNVRPHPNNTRTDSWEDDRNHTPTLNTLNRMCSLTIECVLLQ